MRYYFSLVFNIIQLKLLTLFLFNHPIVKDLNGIVFVMQILLNQI